MNIVIKEPSTDRLMLSAGTDPPHDQCADRCTWNGQTLRVGSRECYRWKDGCRDRSKKSNASCKAQLEPRCYCLTNEYTDQRYWPTGNHCGEIYSFNQHSVNEPFSQVYPISLVSYIQYTCRTAPLIHKQSAGLRTSFPPRLRTSV